MAQTVRTFKICYSENLRGYTGLSSEEVEPYEDDSEDYECKYINFPMPDDNFQVYSLGVEDYKPTYLKTFNSWEAAENYVHQQYKLYTGEFYFEPDMLEGNYLSTGKRFIVPMEGVKLEIERDPNDDDVYIFIVGQSQFDHYIFHD